MQKKYPSVNPLFNLILPPSQLKNSFHHLPKVVTALLDEMIFLMGSCFPGIFRHFGRKTLTFLYLLSKCLKIDSLQGLRSEHVPLSCICIFLSRLICLALLFRQLLKGKSERYKEGSMEKVSHFEEKCLMEKLLIEWKRYDDL